MLVEVELEVSCAGMKMPWVASAACWRKTVEFASGPGFSAPGNGIVGRGSERMSIGIESLWHAKIAFMIGMYWCARSVEGDAEMRRTRDWRDWDAPSPVPGLALRPGPSVLFWEMVDAPIRDTETRIDSLLM